MSGNGISITTADLLADAQRIPPEARGQLLAQPHTVQQMASNLFVRRAMAQQAEQAGLAQDPQVQAALRLARERVLSDAWLERISSQAKPDDAALDALALATYRAHPERFQQPEQVRVRHILIAAKEPDARAQAEQLLQQLKDGADFATLAKERSADSGSAAKGGDLGFFTRGRMVPEFEEAAFALKNPGDLSGVVETKFGFHILQLEERKPAGKQSFDEVRESLREQERANLQQKARSDAAEQIQRGMQVNADAIAAFAASQAKP
ncbi:peptidylprolyl isomerase [Extensimonas sp. H3M7-6]|uniref:peptidylprolyl isomerase n=1 Tax=Extensimonas soli TaxID=3031322 RepID=UPI0023D9F457|nr:peptidylprolyl isomerase [Extensimonas sp. H3M7-6]MDF1482633.1 peptidyl-prolyl cis-trans isomerase [Extensimonas sp. H3M7-6]